MATASDIFIPLIEATANRKQIVDEAWRMLPVGPWVSAQYTHIFFNTGRLTSIIKGKISVLHSAHLKTGMPGLVLQNPTSSSRHTLQRKQPLTISQEFTAISTLYSTRKLSTLCLQRKNSFFISQASLLCWCSGRKSSPILDTLCTP